MLEKCSWLLAYSGPQVQRRPCGGLDHRIAGYGVVRSVVQEVAPLVHFRGPRFAEEGLRCQVSGVRSRSHTHAGGEYSHDLVTHESRISSSLITIKFTRLSTYGSCGSIPSRYGHRAVKPFFTQVAPRRRNFAPDRDPDRGPSTSPRPAILPAVPGCRSRSRQPALLGHRKHPGSVWHPEKLLSRKWS